MVENTNTLVRLNYYSRYLSKIQVFDSTPSQISAHYSTYYSTPYWPNTGSFSNSKAGLSYLPKFALNLFTLSLYEIVEKKVEYRTGNNLLFRCFQYSDIHYLDWNASNVTGW